MPRKFLYFVLIFSLMFACNDYTLISLEPGVSKELADQRTADIKDLKYKLEFVIPEDLQREIEAKNVLTFTWQGSGKDLIIDFKNPAKFVKSVKVGGQDVVFDVKDEHILIPGNYLRDGEQSLTIQFIAGEQALNRNEDFLYTLFVPDKASTAFPCFDQPNLKASYQLNLKVPHDWVPVSNYPLTRKIVLKDLSHYEFEPSLPISSYLFAFAAGKFQTLKDTIDGRPMTMYHRETNPVKIERNAQEIFELHAKSLTWLHEYTGIDYPFKKFDFVLLPAFQFGGMEHPGAIFYKSRSLFLDKHATINQQMQRNALIAHETAHMWFGDLVTMDWFDDVWLKEVFANFMAAKMVNPNFPQINHHLRFLQKHQPSAYGEDRTAGSHPIQQKLENLNQASLLYGSIIYQKAPVVMKQLEAMMGAKEFQEGLQEYLDEFAFGNATWDDLITILDKKTHTDLSSWSQAWVKEAGMPHIRASLLTENNKISSYSLEQVNRGSKESLWKESSRALIGWGDELGYQSFVFEGEQSELKDLKGKPAPDFILPNVSERAYGYFELDKKSQEYLLAHVHELPDDLSKLAAWSTLWESMLRGTIAPHRIIQSIRKGLPHEKEQLGLSTRLGYLRNIYWGFLSQKVRLSKYGDLEDEIWNLMVEESNADKKKMYYDTFIHIAQSPKSLDKLNKIWNKESHIEGIELSTNDHTILAYELAVRGFGNTEKILQSQLARINNPDRRSAMAFVIPALSSDPTVRDAFFKSLLDPENRQKEPWVLRALGYLNHPLRADASEKYIRPGLELVWELQKTNGIFFPKSWCQTLLDGHRSPQSAQILEEFLAELPSNYPYKLKNKILQAADMLVRKSQHAAKSSL